jgi:hypothetical protein
MKKNTFLICLLLSINLIAQNEELESNQVVDSIEVDDSIKRISLGLKIGIPNIIGGTIEGVLPILGNRIAPYFNLSSFNLDVENVTVGLSYTEFGSKVYFGNKGKGFFIGVGSSKFASTLDFKDLSLDFGETGTGSVDLDIKNIFIIKIGAKTGGRIYFNFELGYGIGSIPEELTFNATSTTGETQSTTEKIPNIPGVNPGGGILIGNVGFGISF